MFVPAIESPRLDLVSLSPEFIRAYLNGNFDAASHLVGLRLPKDETIRESVLSRRLRQLDENPVLQPWLLRAIGLRETGAVVGYIGFHDAPGADYLEEFASGGLEIGYTVFASYRGQGYATEACHALMQWAHAEQSVSRFVLSISPQNEPSLRIAQRLGFVQVGLQMDEEDGEEQILVCEFNEMNAGR